VFSADFISPLKYLLTSQLWPIRPNEFLPERTFQWNRFVYLVVHGRELAGRGSNVFPDILADEYLEQIERLESDIPSSVIVPMRREWRRALALGQTVGKSGGPNATANLTANRQEVRFNVRVHFIKSSFNILRWQDICLNWNGRCYRQSGEYTMNGIDPPKCV
jgi:hypothetical protein